MKDALQPRWRTIKGASKAAKNAAREELEQEWTSAANHQRISSLWPVDGANLSSAIR